MGGPAVWTIRVPRGCPGHARTARHEGQHATATELLHFAPDLRPVDVIACSHSFVSTRQCALLRGGIGYTPRITGVLIQLCSRRHGGHAVGVDTAGMDTATTWHSRVHTTARLFLTGAYPMAAFGCTHGQVTVDLNECGRLARGSSKTKLIIQAR